jgi:DNA invertase Pin-like site-specific DNA recombinase
MLTELAEKYKLNITKIYKEIVSGENISARPQMQELLSDMSQNKYYGVLVVEIERLARGDSIDQGIIARAFRLSGTKIITPIKVYDPNNEFDEEYFEFSLFMSRREYKTIKRRMQSGRLASVKEGNYICSSAPYGYRRISPEPKVHTLEIIPEEAETVRIIYDMYLKGHGSKYIANQLNRLGIPPRRSSLWKPPSIKKILSNPVYCGKLSWKTKASGDALYSGKHEPIISENIFNAVRLKKEKNPAAQLHPDCSLKNYYHGVIYCGICGSQMRRRYAAKYGYEILFCPNKECHGKTSGTAFSAVDEAVMTAFRFRTAQLEEFLHDNPKRKNKYHPDLKKALVCELEKVQNQQSRLYDFLERGIYNVDTFNERSHILADKISSMEAELAAFEQRYGKAQPLSETYTAHLQYVLDNFSDASPEVKNAMLKSLIHRVYYFKPHKKSGHKSCSGLTLHIDFL